MRPFELVYAESVPQAVETSGARNGEARYIAGGTNLIDLMKEDVERPKLLIDLAPLDLKDVVENGSGGLRLGALASNANTAYHPLVQERYPLLSDAILAGASAQLRNMATNGGNMMQRTRCYYFYDTATACNKREPGSGCAAIAGVNRIHAILGASDQCIAVYPSDMAVALHALDATLLIQGPQGERSVPITEFHRLPGDRPQDDNELRKGELIVAIDLPSKGFVENSYYLKIRDRQSYAFALVSVAAALELEGSTIKEARIAMGGVAHKPWRDTSAEEMLKGKTATPELFAEVAAHIVREARGYGHNDFKVSLARKAIVRALHEAQKGRKNR